MFSIDDLLDAAAAEKRNLNLAKLEAQAQARELVRSLTAPDEQRVDIAVRQAYDGGATKSNIAVALGESRVTINERLDRTIGVAEPVRKKAKPTKTKAKEEKFAYVTDDENLIKVTLNGESATFQYNYDDVADSYWMTAGDGDQSIVELLDEVWEGDLYDEANAWLKSHQ